MHSWNNSICKTIFKNKNGFLRSGWTILIVMLLYYALLYFASFLVLTALIVILTATGDLNRAADYFSPLANWVNDACLPVAMLILGATIASMPIRELFDDWRVYLFTLFRLGVIPLAVMVLLRALNISTPEITGIMIVLAAMPVATNTTMLAIEYGGNLRLASKGIFFSTILSVITIPVVAMLC